MKRYLVLIFLAARITLIAQVVLNDGVIIHVNGGSSNAASSNIVLNNPPAIPIKQTGVTTSQGIVLEKEFNRVQYNLGNGNTAITVPYISNATGTWVPFPLTVNAISGGTSQAGKTGAIRFSSQRTAGALSAGWDNVTYMPTQVSNVCNSGPGCPGFDNSANVIDRFWIIDPVYYQPALNPAVTLNFTYIMLETDINGGNTASLSSILQPQRFDSINTTSPIWGWNGFPSTAAEMGTNTPGALSATGIGTMNGVQVSRANFFPAWTLASALMPLPIDLLSFTGTCKGGKAELNWVSATETNSDHYTLEKSGNGTTFTFLASVAAQGNSQQNSYYTFTDNSFGNLPSYYRLSETDKNGAQKTFSTVFVAGCLNAAAESGSVYSYNGDVNVSLYLNNAQNVQVQAYDVTGRLVYKNDLAATEGATYYVLKPALAQGIYLFELKTGDLSLTKKILIEN